MLMHLNRIKSQKASTSIENNSKQISHLIKPTVERLHQIETSINMKMSSSAAAAAVNGNTKRKVDEEDKVEYEHFRKSRYNNVEFYLHGATQYSNCNTVVSIFR